MHSKNRKSLLVKTALAASALILASGTALGQQVINLSAGQSSAPLPDGSSVPMWGYTCGATVPANLSSTSCAALNPNAGTAWSPVVITVATGQSLTINLTNNLNFPTGTPVNAIPTSLVIVGQLGGGLGDITQRTTTAPTDHTNAQPSTWPIAGTTPGTAPLVGVGTPPPQGPRVQSFSTEVAAGATVALTWNNLRPGTYLIESGTHPSIQGPMGLYGVLVVTTAPSGSTAGTAYPGVSYNAEVAVLMSEIDPVQNVAVQTAVNTAGFSETMVWSGLPGGCGNPTSTSYNKCYPPAVNYTPLYYLINGVAFDKTHGANSLFLTAPAGLAADGSGTAVSGTVLVRLVNAGLRMHVPSIVGALTGSGTPATPGMGLIAEDGNPLPGLTRVQSEVFMPAGKTNDVIVNVPVPATTGTAPAALPIYDRELSLSANAVSRDAGMLAYISVNGAALPGAAAGGAQANPDTYQFVAGRTLAVADVGKGLISNDVNIYGVQVLTPPACGAASLTLNNNGTFTYVPCGSANDSFMYCGNGATSGAACALVSLNAATPEAAASITFGTNTFTSTVATSLSVKPPGILTGALDSGHYLLKVFAGAPLAVATDGTITGTLAGPGTGTVTVDAAGGFNATVSAPGTYTFTFKAQNSQGVTSAATGTATLVFPAASGLSVKVYDGTDKITPITDYRWVIEEDRTFYVDPTKTTNTCAQGATCPIVPTFGTNFHTSYMPVVATGCTGAQSCESGQTINGAPVVCDVGNGICRTSAAQQTPVDPSSVALDPSKRYYISILPGDAGNDFTDGNVSNNCVNGSGSANQTNPDGSPNRCGHGMGGAPIAAACTPVAPATTCSGTFAPVTIWSQPAPYPPAQLSVFVFEDDFPLNGEQDAGGGIDVLAQNEPGLGQFNITLFDDAGGTGDATGQMTYDMFNQPLVNSLAGTIDPLTGQDACPISKNSRSGTNDPTQTGITGTIVTCPRLEGDGRTLSPLAGQAVVANLMPGRYGVVATPGADRIARGEEWLQTNTLDGQKAHDSFLRIGEPSYFQEFGPAGYHVSIGFANPAIINSRKAGVCNGTDLNVQGTNCTNSITGKVTTERMSRTPDERLYSSGSNDSFAFTQCYVSFGDTDGEDFAFTKCNADGTFSLSGLPDGTWRVTVFDQWNDMLVDGLSTPVALSGGKTTPMGDIAMNQWQANIYTRTFFDPNGTGVPAKDLTGTPCTSVPPPPAPPTPPGCNVNYGNDVSSGLTLVPTNIRFRDGSYSNFNNTDLAGNAGFNEVFPLFSWYVIETDSIRYKNTGVHVVYDAGGPADGTTGGGSSRIGQNMANTAEAISVPASLRVPGAVYCTTADCDGVSVAAGPITGGSSGPTTGLSTGRVDPPWVTSEGWQGFSGQNSFVEFGKKPFAPGETGGIHGEVIYASTRPFDDPSLLIHTSWTPDVPGVTINLYQETTAADGTTALTLIDHTTTSSWDDWAQGFRSDHMPNMNCPGQGRDTGTDADLFFFTLYNQPDYLDLYKSQHGGPASTALPNNSQFKCYDGMHNWNQVQPAPYDGAYSFPSIASISPTTGLPISNCVMSSAGGPGCVANTDTSDPYWSKVPMLPPGKYVVEMVVPPGYELVKEEDKNILIGDNYIAPVTQEFPNLATAIYILPDQAEVSAYYNATNAQNPTVAFGRTTFPSQEGDTGSVETFWPCVGEVRQIPDYISLFPQSQEVAPFAGAYRPLCDRKEITLTEQASALAKFWVFTSAHVTAHFTGVITDDFTSEFDPFSPQFGEKFSPPNMPISFKDWTGTEISRVYSDQWGTYDGITYSTWEVNPPNPTGYAPTMMVTCMNDPGNGPTPDPLFNPEYSQFCYEIPFMPGQTQYMDTPVVPVSAFAGAGYNNPDCAYPDATPAIARVDGTGNGPWVQGPSGTLTITALGDQTVPNNGYSGPAATTAPFNAKSTTRHYGFGSRCTSPTPTSATCNTTSSVTIGGVVAPITGWSDTQITVTVPTTIPSCSLQQQAQYNGAAARCGELIVTAGNGKQSIDAVTVTVGGKAPTRVGPTQAITSIQAAIDGAKPGDLLMVDPGVYNEIVIMWKPVRLQGVGAASTVINANAHPAGKLTPWRARVSCLFGMALNGQPVNEGTDIVFPPSEGPGTAAPPPIRHNPFDTTGAQTCPGTGWYGFSGSANNPQVDRIPLEGIVGWDTTLNGNLAELLQEPTLMGAYEGAGITVVAKGVRYPGAGRDPTNAQLDPINPATGRPYPLTNVFGTGADTSAGSFVAHEGQMPVPTVELQNSARDCGTGTPGSAGFVANPFPSSFQCNPSRIDGLSVTNSSQGGGGIFVHGWAHNLEISNNRVYNNTGTLTGGITVGQGESPDALLSGNGGDPIGYNGGTLAGFDQQPWTCVAGATAPGNIENVSPTGTVANQQLPYCYNTHLNVHNNAVTRNSSIGDELFSSTPAGAGGVSFCVGSDYYKFNYNWLCGNLSTGDGGGLAHIGFSVNGDIEHNQILYNQSTNPTIPTNGGGIIVMGAAPDGLLPGGGAAAPECGSVTDIDCAPGLSDGTGPGLVINANLIQGNGADAGSGGGIRFQSVDGAEVAFFPTQPSQWYSVLVTNNIITNNVAGWDGAGVSLQDALAVNMINNTIVSNDTTASSGVLFNTIGAPEASAPGDSNQQTTTITSAPQAAGVSTARNSSLLTASLPAFILCPVGHGGLLNGSCRNFSVPLLLDDVIWQNRSFYIAVGSLGGGTLNQQNVVSLYTAFTTSQAPSQPSTDATQPNGNGAIITGGTGACTAASYWDVGVRGDHGPADHSSGLTLAPMNSVLTDAGDYTGNNNLGANPTVVSQYCNGSRTPPEFKSAGYQVPPGISDATVPNPIFNLTPAATVDEGNNWINISWGPLAETNPVTNAPLGNYALASGSPAIDYIPPFNLAWALASSTYPQVRTDYFGNARPSGSGVDVGAVEFQGTGSGGNTSLPFLTPDAVNFGSVAEGTAAVQTVTLTKPAGHAQLTGLNYVVSAGAGFTRNGGTCGATLGTVAALQATCTIIVQFQAPATAGTANGTLTVTAGGGVTIAGSPVSLEAVSAPATTLVSITPVSAVRGTTVNVVLAATNLSSLGTTINVPAGSGITVSNVAVDTNAETVSATFTIAANATAATRAISLTSGGQTTNTVNFDVQNPPRPTVSGVNPSSHARGGASFPVTISGTGFSAGATIQVTGGTGGFQNNIAITNVVVVNSTTITARFQIGGTATHNNTRDIRVTTPLGGQSVASAADHFTVL